MIYSLILSPLIFFDVFLDGFGKYGVGGYLTRNEYDFLERLLVFLTIHVVVLCFIGAFGLANLSRGRDHRRSRKPRR